MKKNWIASLIIGSALAGVVVWVSVGMLYDGKQKAALFPQVMTALFTAQLLGCFWQFCRYFRGNTLFEADHLVSPMSGEMLVPEYRGNCELWLFNGGWFSRYHGEIRLLTSTGVQCSHLLTEGISLRGNATPIVLRLPSKPSGEPGTTRVSLRLSPNTTYELLGDQEKIESRKRITVWIKAV